MESKAVKCNNCGNIYYDDITDERNTNSLKIISDESENIKVCPICNTDEFLINIY